jgi:hypothetical protein
MCGLSVLWLKIFMKSKTYCFVFTGEFGYELLNWQGRVRKFSSLHPEVKVICASSAATRLLYSDFAEFIALDSSKAHMRGIADTYFLRHDNFVRDSIWDVFTAYFRRIQLKKFILEHFPKSEATNFRFIFSDRLNFVEDFQFGATRWAPRINKFRKRNFQEIYDKLPIDQNLYVKIEPAYTVVEMVKQKLVDLGVEFPFVAVQSADRITFLKRRRLESATNGILEKIVDQLPTVEISFKPIRESDTQSISLNSKKIYFCSTLEEQVAIISLSSFCIFTSSGDYRSLHYVPSFCGKDNYSITSSSIISNSAIGMWNSEIFHFGGKIIPITTESLLFDEKLNKVLLDYWKSRV